MKRSLAIRDVTEAEQIKISLVKRSANSRLRITYNDSTTMFYIQLYSPFTVGKKNLQT